MPQGLTIWAVFRGLKSQFINRWQPDYQLMSGETLDLAKLQCMSLLQPKWTFERDRSFFVCETSMS